MPAPTKPGTAPAPGHASPAATRPAHNASWFDTDDAPGRGDLETCIHCGLCLMACPTYRELKIEPDSPRGRIYLMRGLAEGRIAPSEPLLGHLDLCLDCRACETVCPAGVPYSRMLEQARGQLARRGGAKRGFGARLGRWALAAILPDRERMHVVTDLLRLSQYRPFAALARAAAARGWMPRFARQGLDMTPALLPRHERALERVVPQLPPGARMDPHAEGLVFHPAGTARARVALFTSCVMETMFPRINQDTVRLLVLAGCEVVVPRAQTCCGALHAHAGERRLARDLARRNVHAFDGTDAIVANSAGCGAALREVGHLLHEDAVARAAEAFAGRVRDVSEVLAELGLPAPARPLASARDAGRPLRVGYHDPCHLAHAQRVRSQPRALLKNVPGVELVDLPNSDWCCGSAGVYNLAHPDMADQQLVHKLAAIAAVAPEVVIASNPGCALHIARGLRGAGSEVETAHLVELLARAYPADRSS